MQYYALINNEQSGPFTTEHLSAMWRSGKVNSDTMIWYEGLSEWIPLSTIEDDLKPSQPTRTYSIPAKNAQRSQQSAPSASASAKPITLFIAVFGAIVLAGAVLIFCWQHFARTTDRNNPFAEEERKDRYELLKAEYRMQENLPQVISFFSDKQDDDSSSVQAQTHQKIMQLCEELSTIIPKIIAAKADNSVSSLIGRQREILKSIDAILAAEHTAEMETRLHVSEEKAKLISIDREYNQKVISMLNQ